MLIRRIVSNLICLGSIFAFWAPSHAQEHSWTSTTGSQIDADLVEIDSDQVTLKINGRPAPLVVGLDKLTEQSRYQAYEIWFNRQDAKQFQMIRQHLEGMVQRPGAVSRLLLEIHKVIPESPYAGVWAAAGISEGENDNVFAKRLLQQSIERIENQQEHLPGRHSMTLASAYNNLGVVALKDRGGNQAAASFTDAIRHSGVVSPILEHNAQLVAQGDTEQISLFELAPRLRSELLTSLASANVSTTKPRLDNSFYYMLDFELPLEAGAASRKIEGLEAPSVYSELMAIGTGFVVAPGIVVTSQQLLKDYERSANLIVTVGTTQQGAFKSLLCKSCLLESTYGYVNRLQSYSGGRASTVFTNFRVVRPASGTANATLMALHVPGLDAEPLLIADDTPKVDSELKLYGYKPGQQMVAEGVQQYEGKVMSSPTPNGIQVVSHDTTNGNRGGPLVDDNNVVHGMVFGLPSNSLDKGGQAFGARIIRGWFNRHVRTTSLKTPDENDSRRQINVEDSVVPVFIWETRRGGKLFSEVADGSAPSESLLIKNSWCLACGGTGLCDCPSCTGGMQSYRTKDVIARSAIAGDIIGTVVKKKKCSTCSGKSKLRCKICSKGRI
ncbi:trypsin-like peptidase domain-containing protein [Roseiconus lacunae]|uniref:trypsin-like peptidase domain-containing protein n=1 Tax=Roseiconus lacunae TaxID=2605694 RepID=UPI001E561CF7|nr:trypsin-like peptidase domain-containing protein [Roseiconus lacunae]MCD0460738.1 peptidase [Roseiconus lacunae]